MFIVDGCDQQTECNCLRKFRNDDHHQYLLSNSHRLKPQQRLDLIALMQNDLNYNRQPILLSPIIHDSIISDEMNQGVSISDETDCTTELTCTIDSFRRKKSSSLNSPANSEHRPTADELERRESPWRCRSYSVSCFNLRRIYLNIYFSLNVIVVVMD